MKKSKTSSGSSLTRRDFLTRTAAGTAMIAFAPVNTAFAANIDGKISWPAAASDYRFHMIGHAHIDPVWLWPWAEGMSVVHSTFQSALDRMNETPDFAFVASSAQFYQWVAENDPQMMKEIKKRVEEGRWNIVGGWWVEPDVNIPNGEAMVRQGLYGQKTFERLLGRKAKIAFNPDSFGHAGTLPQILNLQGMKHYVFMRPGPHEKEIPADLFWWKSPDGSKVLTYRIPISYNETQPVNRRVEQVLERFQNQPMKSFMAFYGAGDHGGGATKENIKSIEELKTENGAPEVIFSTMEKYFEEIDNKNLELPTVNEDLQHHAQGCYTAEIEIKKGNRQSEAALITAEKLAAVGSLAWGANYPKNEFSSAWQRILFLQFHDSLAGTSLPEHSTTAREGYGFSLDIAHQAAYKAIQKLEWQIPAEDPESEYMVVFNPNAWEVRKTVEYDFNWNDRHKSSRVEDEQGNPLPHQWALGTTETGSRKKLLTEVTLPAFGYRQLRLLDADSPSIQDGVTSSNNSIENIFYKISFSENGEIGILDKSTGDEVFAGKQKGCKAIILNDPSDTWSHGVKAFTDEIGAFEDAKVKVIQNGPVKATVRVVSTYGNSTLTIDWSLSKASRNIEADVSLDWHEQLKMLKFSFPVNVKSPEASYEVPYGHIIREANGDENPGQRWIDITGKQNGKTYGLTVMNDAKYGYSVNENDARISVARSAVFAHHRPKELNPENEYRWMDQGIHTFRMLLVPHSDSWKENNVAMTAEEFMAPPICIYQGIHGGELPKSDSFLKVDKTNIIVTSIKQAEDNSDIIVRCVESSGVPTTASIDLIFAASKWSGKFRACEIKSLRLNSHSGKVNEVNVLEEL
ncbi:twin-arginine translocation signal domain-containing protein [Maribellus comscasis]|uniref:Twin-arginine translocation signal domain-containing protein n=1 Tax=Maribellus comscasis TaxID=2681766 RepID=A0A6I6K0A8_9BACT|nr:glycoside hydrolase family 38 C-terminal domain-containing protein [Maribellus comscasis]QGY47019.1 twin-arginine translocation signal domain-containing protein [Maribellus comscasis]